MDERDELTELLERRASIERWLDGLEAQRGTASERILARVRADYEGRLAETLDALSSHVEGVRNELGRVQERIQGLEGKHSSSMDELEEARVRNAIGELSDQAWTERRTSLEVEVETAHADLVAARQESERLRELLKRLGADEPIVIVPDSGPEPAGPLAAAVAAQQGLPTPVPFDDETTIESWDEEIFPESSEGFLDAIDRALTESSGSAAEPAPRSGPSARVENGEAPEFDTAPKPGLKCGECGYTNDINAWFCGVCGADIG